MKPLFPFICLFILTRCLLAQDIIYENNFEEYKQGDDLLRMEKIKIKSFKNEEALRTVTINKEYGTNYLTFDIPNADTSKPYNTLITCANEISFARGKVYTITLRTRGTFERGIRIINKSSNRAIAKGGNYNVSNSKVLAEKWHEHTLEYTPFEDFIGFVGVLRSWNGALDIDDIKVTSTENRRRATGQDLPYVIYQTDFNNINQDKVNTLFKVVPFQQNQLKRELLLNEQYGNNYLTLEMEDTKESANTMVFLNTIFSFKEGESYTVTVKTRGKFKRLIKLIDIEDKNAVIASKDSDASKLNSKEWFNHYLFFTAKKDFEGQIGVIRLWNNNLDIDDIVIKGTVVPQ
ncbi:hypothetical protein [Flammeovirga pacifica]|uniref:Uncharacterized protein n=1 Tax=Flammeovirga pacifica TaxID=915059 RepID=A0A1S1Z322_FLAPC|nr:hypothetical protein [Flammeovirga pacifica]OHX67684.1 hypothetical protein NH26_15660 [Flammeovirga pacifica]